MNFGTAIEYAWRGARIRRTGWNGKGMWVFHIDLRQKVAGFEGVEFPWGLYGSDWLPFLAMRTADARLVPWLASQTDLLAEDWEILP